MSVQRVQVISISDIDILNLIYLPQYMRIIGPVQVNSRRASIIEVDTERISK